MRYSDCIRQGGDCTECSLSNYGRDCHNNPANGVAYRRLLRGLTQQGLADAAGMHIRQIQKLESGETDPANMTLKNALSLAFELEIEPKDLLP